MRLSSHGRHACALADSVTDRASLVPADIAQEVGLAKDQVQVNDKYGGGYPANVEGLHHLHCLVRFNAPALVAI